MRKVILAIFICAVLLFSPYRMQYHGVWYSDDDWDYFAHSTAIAFGEFPSYKKEFFQSGVTPLGSIGPGLMAAPFVFGFSLLDRLETAPIVEKRTLDSTKKSWSHFGFVFASSLYFILGCLLLYDGLVRYVPDRYASWSIILMIICQGIPLFVYRRPIFSHVFEFFLQSCMVYLLLLKGRRVDILKNLWTRFGVGVLIGLIYLVRFNNVFSAVAWPLVLSFDRWKAVLRWAFWKKVIPIFFAAFVMIVLFKILPNINNDDVGYGGHLKKLTTLKPVLFYFKRLWHILVGLDWGMVYTMPFVFFGFGFLVFSKVELRKFLSVMLLPMLVNLYIVMMWKTQGGWYGYRYIMASLFPLLVYPFALCLKKFEDQWGPKALFLFVVLAILPVLSVLAFEGRQALNLANYQQYFDATGYGNNFYQVEVWKIFLFQPFELVKIIFQKGIMYFLYLFLVCLSKMDVIQDVYIREYIYFDFRVLIKTMILYVIPFVCYVLFLPLQRKRVIDESSHTEAL
ncbi:MAG: hypothetical protein K8S27_05450 [Candidatus Omnitrophica bacterium]|nr:hypothetical protein [Candidatus Omnitrophota bacterium]